MDIERIIKKYYKQLDGHKFYNLDVIKYFLEGRNQPKLTEEIKNPSRRISFKNLKKYEHMRLCEK